MYQPVIDRSYLVEIKLVNPPTAGDTLAFQDIPQIRNVFTIGLQCFNASDLTISPNSNAVVTLLTGLILTLNIESTEEIYQFPCNDLRPGFNSGLIRLLKEKKINWPKSYITILNAAGLAQNQAVVFNAIYRKVKAVRK